MSRHRLAFSGKTIRPLLACGWLLVGLLAGCQTINFHDQSLDEPVPLDIEPPRELSKISLPAYRIEPPDVLQIEMLKLVPLPPYRLEPYDVLQLFVVGTPPQEPIAGYFMLESDGRIVLGASYGSLRIAGMSTQEATEAIRQHLAQILVDPAVSLQLARAAALQPLTGYYLVGPDGTVNLRQYGAVSVAGKTAAEAKAAIQEHMKQFVDSPELSVDVASYNSKFYYIITEGAGLGENVVPVPVTGNETVLDAISRINGLSQLSSKEIWVARPAPAEMGCEQIMPVDWEGITKGGLSATNYQVLPGDRIYIAGDPMISFANFVGKLIGPVERVAGIASLTASSVRNYQTLGRTFNRRRY